MVAERVELRPLGGRSLKTAAEALSALRILGDNPAGVTADVLAAALGKSAATARYLLNTLCQEGFAVREGGVGVHRLVAAPPWGEPWGRSTPAPRYELPERLSDAVTELHHRTRQRTYLAQWDDDTTIIVDARGHQGLARIPDLTERIPLAQAHALAVTKALLAGSEEMEARAVGQAELAGFTPTTITGTSALSLELERVRRSGLAVDREEFAEGFCCVGAPIVAPDGRVAASIAVSTPARRFAHLSGEITRAVSEVAAEASRAWREQAGDEELPEAHCPFATDHPAPTDHPTHDTAEPADPPGRRRRRSARAPTRGAPEEVAHHH